MVSVARIEWESVAKEASSPSPGGCRLDMIWGFIVAGAYWLITGVYHIYRSYHPPPPLKRRKTRLRAMRAAGAGRLILGGSIVLVGVSTTAGGLGVFVGLFVMLYAIVLHRRADKQGAT